MTQEHPILFAEALFGKSHSTCSLIAREYRPKLITMNTHGNFISSTARDWLSHPEESEVNLDTLPESIVPQSLRPKKTRRKTKKDSTIQKDGTWDVESSDEGENDMTSSKHPVNSPPVNRLNRNRLMEEEEMELDLDPAPINHPLTVLSDDEEAASNGNSLAASNADIHSTRKKRVISDESSDDSGPVHAASKNAPPKELRKEHAEVNTSPWTEEEDAMLRRLLEESKDVHDPWGMVAYDSFFLDRHRSPRGVMQRGIELGLLDKNTVLPEESVFTSITSESSSSDDEDVLQLRTLGGRYQR